MKRGAELVDADKVPAVDQPCVVFFAEVRQARAQARQVAEARVFAESPFNWLRYGPGRERDQEPGWTESSQVDMTSGGQPVQLVPWAAKPPEIKSGTRRTT
jgi:hypothetical protein